MTIKKLDPDMIVSHLTMPLRFSSKQENRIKSALKNVEKKFSKLIREHSLAVAEAQKWRFEINDLRYEMNKLNKTVPDVIRPFLDSEQREKFDQMLGLGQKKTALKKAAGADKPIRKRRERIRKKKLPAVKHPGTEGALELPGLEPAAHEHEAGTAGEEDEIPFGAYP